MELLWRKKHEIKDKVYYNIMQNAVVRNVVWNYFGVKNTKLTLRRLMSYIYIYMEHLFLMFLDHTQRRSTVGRTPLDE